MKWLFNNKQTTRRLNRWALQLQAYKFDVIHIRGRNNSNADALSRLDYVSLDNCQDCNYCHSNPTSEQVDQLDSELSKLADDVMQDPSDIQCNTKPTETVNVVRNLRYKQGKRVVCDQNEVNQNVPPVPSDIHLEKFEEVLLTDNFAGSMFDYLMQQFAY